MRKFLKKKEREREREDLHFPDFAVDKNNRIQKSVVNVIIKLSV